MHLKSSRPRHRQKRGKTPSESYFHLPLTPAGGNRRSPGFTVGFFRSIHYNERCDTISRQVGRISYTCLLLDSRDLKFTRGRERENIAGIETMHVLIYGAGALGQALGCMLAAAGNQVTLVIRERFIEVIGRSGLSVDGIFGSYHVEPGKLSLTASLTGEDGSLFDAALITTKSYDTAAAVIDLNSLRGCSCPIVSMQNGCGNIEQLLRAFGPERCFGARIITGFEIAEPARISITVSADDIHIGSGLSGSIPEQAALLARTISDAGLPCIAVEDVHLSLFAKLLYNCALNPLGAILGVNYGALSERRESRAIMNAVIEETFTVIGAMGKKLPWADPEEYRDYFYQTLIPATYDHRPSMLQDLEQGKPTEVAALVGYVSQNGRNYNLATPCCDLLGRLVRFKEQAALRS